MMKPIAFFTIVLTAFLALFVCSAFEGTFAASILRKTRRRTVHRNTNPSLSGHLTTEGKLRLVGGRVSNEGNVEIYHAGRWGSICDDEWDMSEGDVACRSLGHQLGAESVTDSGQFGRGRSELHNLYNLLY